MDIIFILCVAFIFATGTVCIWQNAERALRCYLYRRKKRADRLEKKAAAQKTMREFARRQIRKEKEEKARRKWEERTGWREEIDILFEQRKGRTLYEKL